jgi:EAL domain-containing protein (putative c-di-GMP-specific phosphodiesterase class I)
MDTVHSIGCTEMQGYLFSRARPAEEIGQFFPSGAVRAPDVA